MTEQYKERLLAYLTGNYNVEQKGTDPLFYEFYKSNTTINSYIDTIDGYIQAKSNSGSNLDIGFIYGEKAGNGIIIVVDNDFNIIQVIDEFESGTKLRPFINLNIDITNGKLYGIDYEQNAGFRLVLLNNISSKPLNSNYSIKLLKSYLINFENSVTPKYIEKNPNSSEYMIIGTYKSNGNDKPAVVKYTVNVGSTNEIKYYLYSDGEDKTYTLENYNIQWGDTYLIKLAFIDYVENFSNNMYSCYYDEFRFDGEQITRPIRTFYEDNYLSPSMQSTSFNIVVTNNDCYICSTLGETPDYYDFNIYKLNYQNNSFSNVYNLPAVTTLFVGGNITYKEGNIYFTAYRSLNNSDVFEDREFEVAFGIIDNNNTYSKLFKPYNIWNLVGYTKAFQISIVNNLISYKLIGSNSTDKITCKQIFNRLNYNCNDYQALNSMVANSSILYDDNNKIIYAKNLYNKTIFGQMTSSTIDIPNNMLNNVIIKRQSLLSETNSELVNNIENIEKNIYENVFINFHNKISILNNNDINQPEMNTNGAIRLNQSVSNTLDYEQCKIGKYKINYDDNTSFISTLDIPENISQTYPEYKYTFYVYVPTDKSISNIQLLSFDEETIYLTINASQFKNNKIYKISQKVKIGG